MKKFILLASLATLTLTAVSAEARERWRNRQYDPWQDRPVYLYEDEDEDDDDDVAYYDDEYEDDVVIIPKRRLDRRQQIEERVERELWWLENGARNKLEKRAQSRKVVQKPVVKKAVAKPLPAKAKVAATAKVAPKAKAPAAAKTDKQALDTVQTASLSKPEVVAKPKPVTAKPSAGKTIGCTAGAAVVTGYGFAAVKPKACSGATYAYTASRAGKNYEIQLTAASGEITDVKKLN